MTAINDLTTPPQASRILIVDDNPDNRAMLLRRLDKRGFEVSEVATGDEALTRIALRTPDLVLLDNMMPGMSGLEVLRRLRLTYGPAELPIIMVTALSGEADIVDALEAGANDYVTKPISLPVLLARLTAQLARQRAERALRRARDTLDARVTERRLEIDELTSALAEERVRRRELEAELAALRPVRAGDNPAFRFA